jgi:glycosyltransferase involved in cell wall biosynthesis
LEAYNGIINPPPLVIIGRKCADIPKKYPENVFVFDRWPHGAVLQAFRRSMIGLVPSICPDACPTVVMEAMAAGIPVIGSRTGGIPDLVSDGINGILVAPDDINGLRNAMTRLIDDVGLRESLGRHALEKSSDFQAKSVVNQIQDIYDRLCKL